MIEETIRTYLKGVLSAPVEVVKPTDQGITEFVLIEKTGSSRENYINRARFAIQSYSDTLYGAMSLNEAVKDAMLGDGVTTFGIAYSCDVAKCSLNSDYNYTDTTTKQYRYQAVFDLVY